MLVSNVSRKAPTIGQNCSQVFFKVKVDRLMVGLSLKVQINVVLIAAYAVKLSMFPVNFNILQIPNFFSNID